MYLSNVFVVSLENRNGSISGLLLRFLLKLYLDWNYYESELHFSFWPHLLSGLKFGSKFISTRYNSYNLFSCFFFLFSSHQAL